MLLRTAALTILLLLPCAAQQTEPVGRVIPGRFLVSYHNRLIPGDAEFRTRHAGGRLLHRHERSGIAVVQSVDAARDSVQILHDLAAQPNVESVIQDRLLSASAITAGISVQIAPVAAYDGLYNSPQGWAVRAAGGYGAGIAGGPIDGPWSKSMGRGVRIAILDSGIDATHPDLAPNLALNLSEIDRTVLPSPCDDGSPQDQQGHGTWTASLAAAAAGPGTGSLIGVAPQATLLNIKVLERLPASASDASTCATGQAGGLLSWVLQGIDDAVAQHADIISMSLGTLVDITTGDGAGVQAAFNRVTDAATQAGVLLIASAGNDGVDLTNPRYVELPAQARGVLAIVAATNPDCSEDLLAGTACSPGPISLPYYSNYGAPLHAIAAPGGSYPAGPESNLSMPTGWIRGACSAGLPNTADASRTSPDATHSFGCFGLGHVPYVQAMGTSAAAPLAAGAAALILAAHPGWSPAQLVAALHATANPVTNLPVPMLNTAAALGLP